MVMDVGRGNLERVVECVGVEEGECPLLLWSARASNFCERDDILYHQATSRTKTLQDSRKKQDDITTWTIHVFVIRCFVGRWLTSYRATRRAG